MMPIDPPLDLFTIASYLEIWSYQTPEATALLAPERSPLSFAQLREGVERTVRTLNEFGIGRQDRVALVLPNGPDAAVGFLALTAGATCAPLNPEYRTDEFDFYLSDMHACALIVQAERDSPARAAAKARGIPLIELTSTPDSAAGIFTLRSAIHGAPKQPGFTEANDIALVLHTSGTTSRPKLVPLSHRNLCASARHICATLQLTPHDRSLNIMPLFHIHGLIAGLLASLAAGGSVVCAPGLIAPNFFAWLAEFRPTWYTAVPTMHQTILARASTHREILSHHSLRLIRSSSAPLPAPVLSELERVFNVPVLEAYGMTEAAHQMASNPPLPYERKLRSVGRAAGPQVEIMDDSGNILTADEIGEVVVRGPNVMTGYENNSEANGHAFTHGWFRTGDLGYLDSEGYLFLTGRIKEIINRGGEKISPREVDEVMMGHPDIDQVITFAMPDPILGEEVAIAVVLRENAHTTESDIREFASTRLADFKVPRRVVFLQEIPKGPSGKLQRIGLADKLGLTNPRSTPVDFVAPRNSMEERLARIWRISLGVDRIGIRDNFFEAGGDSLLAGLLLTRVYEEFQVQLSLIDLFERGSTIAEMALLIIEEQTSGSQHPLQPIPSAPHSHQAPLSLAQKRWWFLHELDPDGFGLNRPLTFRLRGALDRQALRTSLADMVQRHAIFRTTFPIANDEPHQAIAESLSFDLTWIDLAYVPESERDVQIKEHLLNIIRAPFDLARGPIWRAALFGLTDTENLLLLCIHHIALDGASIPIIFHELAAGYRDAIALQAPSIPELPIQYADFARWQQDMLSTGQWDDDLKYWSNRLHPPLPRIELPTDHPRPSVVSFTGAREHFQLSKELSGALLALSKSEGVTLFMTLLAALATWLSRETQSEDLIIGTSAQGRARVEFQNIIGFFANVLALRVDASGNPSFRHLLERVRHETLGALTHQAVPFERLIHILQPTRNLVRSPIFDVQFILKSEMEAARQASGLVIQYETFDPQTAQFDLTIEMWEAEQGLRGYFEYNTDIFESATIARWCNHFRTLLAGIVTLPEMDIAALTILSNAEQEEILVEWNNTDANYPRTMCIHQLFEAQVARTPDAIAIRFGPQTITFHELNGRANQIADSLRNLGLLPETLIGLCSERSPEMIIGLLGILKTGGAYVPLDPGYPRERLAFMIEDANLKVIVTQRALKEKFADLDTAFLMLDGELRESEPESKGNLPVTTAPENLAYVLYTSGSTGQPKGVCIEHRNTVAFLSWASKIVDTDLRSGMLCSTSINFDLSILEIFLPLCWGGTIILAENVLVLPSLAQSNQIHFLQTSPSAMVKILEAEGLPASVSTVVLGGEPLPEALARKLLEAGKQVWNLYGPTETTTYSTGALILPDAEMPPSIGRPVENTKIYILDAHRRPVPVGVIGELYIGGAGVARGYLNRAELTTEKFIRDPYAHEPNARMYQTGDLARYRPDGTIQFIGRRDNQIKVHGFRIEAGEIEVALKCHKTVREAVVVAYEKSPNEKQLVAYLVPDSSVHLSTHQLRDFLKQKLPEHMIPSTFVWLDEWPMTPNGKLDRHALPQPRPSELDRSGHSALPRDRIELELCHLWENLLNVSRVGPHDNFFELGGDSFLAARICTAIASLYGHQLPLRVFFDAPTVESISTILRVEGRQPEWSAIVPIQPQGALSPLFYFPPLNTVLSFYPLTATLGNDQPVYGLLASPRGDHNPFSRIEDEAAYYVEQICTIQPHGPYYLAGWSYGGITAFETAQQLLARSQSIAFLGVMDTGFQFTDWRARVGYYRRRLSYLAGLNARDQITRFINHARFPGQRAEAEADGLSSLAGIDPTLLPGNDYRGDRIRKSHYRPRMFPGRVVLFRTRDNAPHQARDPLKGWERLARGGVEVYDIDGEHGSIMNEPQGQDLRDKFHAALIKAQKEILAYPVSGH